MTSASQSVLEHTDATSTRPLPASLSSSLTSSSSLVTPSSSSSTTATTPRDVVSVARNDLRSMSQRLERLLRERREATERRPQQERSLERRTLDILDRRLGRGAPDLSMPSAPLSDSSPSDSEEERGEEGRARRRESRRDMIDFFDHDSFLRNRRISRNAAAATGDTWRPLSMRERLDIRWFVKSYISLVISYNCPIQGGAASRDRASKNASFSGERPLTQVFFSKTFI